MTYNPEIHNRHSMRLKGYDYSQRGAYFITICAWNRECLFGEIIDRRMRMHEFGEIAHAVWNDLSGRFQGIELDAFIVMPNHVHGIINIVGAQFIAPELNQGAINRAPTLGQIVRAFKAGCAFGINKIRNTPGAPVWQRNYYEHIIRNEKALNNIRRYIQRNPCLWDCDAENPLLNNNAIHELPRIARSLGFTDEELDFIINYDIKYRMGRDANDDD